MQVTLTRALSQYKEISELKGHNEHDPRDIAERFADLGGMCYDELKLPMVASRFLDEAAYELRKTNPRLTDPIMDTVHYLEQKATELKQEAVARITGQESVDYFSLPVDVQGRPGLEEVESIVTAFLGYCGENGLDPSKLCLKLQSTRYPDSQKVLNFKINGLTVITSPISKSIRGEFDMLLALRSMLGENSIELLGVLYNKETMSTLGYVMEYFRSTGDIPKGSSRTKDKSYYNQFLRSPDNAVSLIDRFASAMVKTSESEHNHGDANVSYLGINGWFFMSNTLIDEPISRFVVIDAMFKGKEGEQGNNAKNKRQLTMPTKDPSTRDRDAANKAIDEVFRLLSDHLYEIMSGQYEN